MRGYYLIRLTAEDSNLARSSNKRTGEQRLAIVEKQLRKDGIAFVEDFAADDTVIVRYGDYATDECWQHALDSGRVTLPTAAIEQLEQLQTA